MLNSEELINKVKIYNKFLNPAKSKALFNFSGFKNLLYILTLFINSSEFNILYYTTYLNFFNRTYIST